MSLADTDPTIVCSAAPAARWQRLMSSASVGLAVFTFLMCVASRLLNDPDSQWHVAVGRWIWEHGRAPWTDPFSHTFFGASWIAKEWSAQLVLFAAWHVAGWLGVVAISAVAIAAAFALLFDQLRRLRFSVALALTLVAVLLCAPHLLARPHALVLPVMVLWTIGLVAARERDEAPPLWLPVLMVLWTNLHGSFPLGLMLAGLLAGEGILFGMRGTVMTRLRGWAPFIALSFAAVFVTPYGWHALLVPLQMAGKGADLSFIGEWRPLAVDTQGALALALCGFALWALSAAPRANAFRIAAILLLAAMMVRHARFVDQFALLAPILFAAALARRSGCERGAVDAPAAPLAFAVTLFALAASIVTVRAAPQPNLNMTPQAALDAALARHVTGPVYNAYDFGGFLIAHDIPTFVDGRTDQLFLGTFMRDLDRARVDKGETRFEALLDQYNVAWALVRSDSADRRHLARLTGWSKLYEDGVAVVFVRDR